jgi:hypothetical protein
MKKTMIRTNRQHWWSGVLAASLLLATQIPSCANGGIGGSGTVSGFGSIFVNGVEWFTETAQFQIDGIPGSEADLQLGMVVVFEGRLDASGETGTVSQVSFDDAIEGPVEEIDLENPGEKLLTILGQSVSIRDGFTLFDEFDPSLHFGAIGVGDVLEVSGYVDGEGDILASWVRRLGTFVAGATHVELEGEVSGLTPGSEFHVGSVTVVLEGTTDLSELASGLANGVEVEVEGVALSETVVLASRVAPPEGLPANVGELSLEGVVTDFQGIHSFRVAGQLIDATSSEFEPPDFSFLADGVLVEVEGPLIGGILLADEVRLEETILELTAPLMSMQDVDVASNRIWLLGVEVQLDADTELIDDRDEVQGFGLQHVAAGDFLEAQGPASLTGGVLATRLNRTSPGEIKVLGPVSSYDAGTQQLEVMGILVDLTPETEIENELENPISTTQLFSSLWIGREVELIRLEARTGGTWTASEIELKD